MNPTEQQIINERAAMLLRTIAAIQNQCARLAADMTDRHGDFRLPKRKPIDRLKELTAAAEIEWGLVSEEIR